MKESKHIDRLFQESFKDFEAIPRDAVWSNIEAKLNQKKKDRKIFPIWWRYAGVAALLLLLLTIGNIYFNDNKVPENQIADTKDASPSPSNTDEKPIFNNAPNTSVNVTSPQNGIEGTKTESFKTNPSQSSAIVKTKSENQNVIVNNSNSTFLNKTGGSNNLFINKNNSVANINEENPNIEPQESKPILENIKTDDINNDDIKSNITSITNTKKTESDSLIENSPKNKLLSIEEALTDAENIKEEKINKWSIATNAAPVYFNSLGKGSSIDAQFNENSKSGELNMSYGVTASYAVNKNLSIRSGINKVNLGYNTNNVVVFETVGISSSSSLIKNIDTNNTAENISLISGEGLGITNRESFIKTSNTSINQTLGYIEIPLEIQYAIINKKLGVNVIGGFSSFFLSENKIFSEIGGKQTLVGEANNINKVSYSANFGLGMSYKVSKKINLNLEPMFKYQINTFNNTSGNFKPYFIGVYTGFGFKF